MREFTVDNNGINTNLIYTLKDNDKIDTVALGMMENNKINGLLPMLYTQVDTDKLLKYNVTSRVTMQQLYERSVSKKMILKCFSNIIDAVINAEDYMIDISTLLIDIKYIYVNVSTLDTELICLPILEDEKKVDIEMFFKSIIFSVQFDQTENCDYVAKLISFLNSGNFSLREFKQVLRELEDNSRTINNPNNDVSKETIVSNVNVDELPGKTIVDASLFEKKENIPSVSVENRTPVVQMKQNIEKPVTIPQVKIDEKKVKKEKKGLFGKKKETKKDNVAPKMSIPGMAVPGMAVPAMESPSIKKDETKKSNIVVPGSVAKPIETNLENSIPQTTFTQSSANFGETTVLNVPSSGIGETTVLGVSSGNAQTYEPKPYLIRKKNNERILISKSVFKIGKENSYVDYFIGDNTAISRSHATILTKGNNYYLMDTNSKNHTFVNGTMISPNIEVPVKPGAIIKLADEEFEFVMQ